jgi:hypothetical protein
MISFFISPISIFSDFEAVSFFEIGFLMMFTALRRSSAWKEMAAVVLILVCLINYCFPILLLLERISNFRIVLTVGFWLDTGLLVNSNGWLTESYLDRFGGDWNVLSVVILSEIIIFVKSRYIYRTRYIYIGFRRLVLVLYIIYKIWLS